MVDRAKSEMAAKKSDDKGGHRNKWVDGSPLNYGDGSSDTRRQQQEARYITVAKSATTAQTYNGTKLLPSRNRSNRVHYSIILSIINNSFQPIVVFVHLHQSYTTTHKRRGYPTRLCRTPPQKQHTNVHPEEVVPLDLAPQARFWWTAAALLLPHTESDQRKPVTTYSICIPLSSASGSPCMHKRYNMVN